MNIEVALQSFSSLILPTIYLFIIATFIFTRSYQKPYTDHEESPKIA